MHLLHGAVVGRSCRRVPFAILSPMQRRGGQSVLRMLTPNVESLGYALFLAINAAGVWGGVFPFLPIAFQTHTILFWFFLTQSVVFSFSYIASCVGSYFLPGPTRRFLATLTSAIYFVGWCLLIAAIYIDALALPLVCMGGAMLGLGSAGFYMLWQRVFAGQDADAGSRDLLVGSAWGAVFYFALYLIPQAVTAYLIPLVFLPLFGLCVTLGGRAVNPDQPMFADVPREHPHVYRQVLGDHWRSALCIGAVGFCAGVMRSMAVAEPAIGINVNVLSMAGMLVSAIVVIWLWSLKGVRLSITDTYRVVFPFLITSFLLLPVMGDGYTRFLASVLYAVYAAYIMLMMMQCAQVSRDRGINPVFVYGFFGAIVYTLHSVGFLGGTFAEDVRILGMDPLAVVALVSVWTLGIMHFMGSGGFTSALPQKDEAPAIELVALRRPSKAESFDAGAPNDASLGGALETLAGEAVDRIAVQASRIRDHFRLSAREAEVMELLARGNSVARIAEMLVVSENTVRTHSKRIYVKLDIHKRQELVDLIESF